MSTVQMLKRGELEARRRDLVARAGITEEELRARGEEYSLTDGEAAILDELEDLDFLLNRG